MNIGKRLIVYSGVVCLLVSISFGAVSAETQNPETADEKNVSEPGDAADGLESTQPMDTGNPSNTDIRYVRDFIVITLRAGMGDEYKVIGNLKTDDRIEVLQEEEEFLRVTTDKGEEGWVRSRYITKDVPKLVTIERLRSENDKLNASLNALQDKISEMGRQKNAEIEQRDGTSDH